MKKLVCVCVGIVLWAPLASSAGDLAKLYAPRPPQGSSYVRILNPAERPVQSRFAGQRDTLAADGHAHVASDYRVTDGAQPLPLSVDGMRLGEIRVAADRFVTVVLRQGATPPYVAIEDDVAGSDDLKAQLRFYNLVPGCAASLALSNGARVFEQVPTDGSRKRAINPVKATLSGSCAGVGSAPLALPQLGPGDRYSLFLVGSAAAPRLLGQLDRTAPYAGKP